MITKELLDFAGENWGSFKSTIAEISKSNQSGGSLVNSSEPIYNFDQICMSLFPEGQVPASADGIKIYQNKVILIEFKSGFKSRITKDNYDEQKARCDETGKGCKPYWELLVKNRNHEIIELKNSIRFKAVESYITYEKRVLPELKNSTQHIPLMLIVVIDEDEVDEIEDTLAELADEKTTRNNHISEVRQSLSRLVNQCDANGKQYYYDRIEVISAQDFANKLKF